jgi:hypothetical protein
MHRLHLGEIRDPVLTRTVSPAVPRSDLPVFQIGDEPDEIDEVDADCVQFLPCISRYVELPGNDFEKRTHGMPPPLSFFLYL